MSWYYANGNQQSGPVDQDTLLRLLQDGQITRQTLVWQEGMSDWRPLGEIETLASATSTAPAAMSANTTDPHFEGMQACPTCSTPVLPEVLIPYGNTHICPNCRNDYIQRLKEGAPAQDSNTWNGGTGGQTPNNEIKAQARDVLSGQWGEGVLFGFLYILLTMGISFVPYLGSLASFLCNGAFSVGYCIFWLRFSRRQETTNGMMFEGFTIFGKAFGTYIIFSLIILVVILFAGIPGAIVSAIFQPWETGNSDPTPWVIVGLAFTIPLITALLIVSFQYSQIYFILADNPDTKMLECFSRSKHLMQGRKMKYFRLNLIFTLLYMVAGIAFIIPILWVIPYHWTALACFYNDLQEPSNTPQNTL